MPGKTDEAKFQGHQLSEAPQNDDVDRLREGHAPALTGILAGCPLAHHISVCMRSALAIMLAWCMVPCLLGLYNCVLNRVESPTTIARAFSWHSSFAIAQACLPVGLLAEHAGLSREELQDAAILARFALAAYCDKVDSPRHSK